jgi:uncharacterized membrane protein
LWVVLFLIAIVINDGTGTISSRAPLLLISIATGALSLLCFLALFSSRLRKTVLQVSEERQYFPPLLAFLILGSFMTTVALFTAIFILN